MPETAEPVFPRFFCMMKWLAHLVIGLCLTCLLSGSAVAAVVVLANGDRLSGKIISETSREITLEHKVLGILKIPRRQLAGPNPIPTEKPSPPAENIATEVENEKTSGRESAAEELPNEPLETAEQTGKPAPKDSEKAPVAKAVPAQPTSSQNKMTPKLMGLFGSHFLEGWKRHFAFGFGGESGDDESSEWNVSLEGNYKDKSDRISMTSAYYYETEDHEKDTSKGHVNLIRDWLLPDSPWFYYAYFLYEHDYFKSWKNRYSISGGTGYDFINTEDMELSGRVGLGLSRSFGSEDKFETEGQIGMEWNWIPFGNKKNLLSFRFVAYPILNDLGEYRTWCQGKWKIGLDLFKGLSFETGFEHEYESQSEMNVDDEAYYDLIYFGRLGIDF
jgi:hypothetical protein